MIYFSVNLIKVKKNQKLISQTNKVEKGIEKLIAKDTIAKPFKNQQNPEPIVIIKSDNSLTSEFISNEEFCNSTKNSLSYKDETICMSTSFDEYDNNSLCDSEFLEYTTMIRLDCYPSLMLENHIEVK